MFTGLVEGMGFIVRVETQNMDRRIFIVPQFEAGEIFLGESIAVDGACLTVTALEGSTFGADVSTETLRMTTLGDRKVGDRVNLERALKVGYRLGGHIVMGHVDGVGILSRRYEEGRSIRLVFRIPDNLEHYIVEKGSVAVNGVSLTVNSCKHNIFDVNIVPHTAAATTIKTLNVGDKVNIEVDVIGKYIEKLLKRLNQKASKESNITEDLLKEHGFI